MRSRSTTLATVAIAAGLIVASACGAEQPERETRVVTSSDAAGAAAKPAAAQFAPSVSARAAKAAKPTLVADGENVRVERVALAEPVTVHVAGTSKQTRGVLRITIRDTFRAGALPPVVHVGGKVVGPAVESDDLRSITVAVADESLIVQGAEVGYGYGTSPAKVVATLRVVK